MNVVDFAQGFVLKARGDEYVKDDKATAKHFFNLALQKYEESLHANPYNKWTLVNILVLVLLAQSDIAINSIIILIHS
jgi:hypothetical protein